MLKATPLMPGVDEILLPGERAWRASREQSTDGILLPGEVVADLSVLATALGIEPLAAR
jgi:LDH2 family malate/lactate/ureidoglycolate dehydrogenase